MRTVPRPFAHARSAAVALAIVAVVALSACGGDGKKTTTSTVVAPTAGATPRAITGISEVDQVVNAALDGDAIRLAALTGYQKVPCAKTPPQGSGAPPACRDTENEGKSVEVLPSTACESAWVRPEQLPDAYRSALEGRPQLFAVFVPKDDPNAFGGSFGTQYVAVLSTGQDGGVKTGVALNVKDGRVVWIQRPCADFLALAPSSRVQSYIVAPPDAGTSVVPSPTAAP